jgi:hypothetical protein
VTDEIPKDLHPDLEGVCPCGRKFFVDTGTYSVIHELPVCERFMALEPDKFLRWVRETITGIMDN